MDGRRIKPFAEYKSVASKDVPAMTVEEYLSTNGYPFMGEAEPALHKGKQKTSNQQDKIVERQLQKSKEYSKKREELRKEYEEKVSRGEIRRPSREDLLIKIANGHPDNESTQAARRSLEKRGIDWGNTNSVVKEPQLPLFAPNAIQSQLDWSHETDHVSQMESTPKLEQIRKNAGYESNHDKFGDVTFVERQLSENGSLTFMGSHLTGAPQIKTSEDIIRN